MDLLETIRTRLERDLRREMLARNRLAVDTIRTLLSAIDNAGAVPATDSVEPTIGRFDEVPRRAVDEDGIRSVLEDEAAELEGAAVTYDEVGRADEAERLRARRDLVLSYLD